MRLASPSPQWSPSVGLKVLPASSWLALKCYKRLPTAVTKKNMLNMTIAATMATSTTSPQRLSLNLRIQ
jgi:hypothetical protein